MNPHFFTAPFYFCFHLIQGSGFKVQGSRFRGEVAASPPFYFDIHSTPLVLFYAPQHFRGSFCIYRTR